MSDEYLIKIEHLAKSFGDLAVLKDISFSVKKTSIHVTFPWDTTNINIS